MVVMGGDVCPYGGNPGEKKRARKQENNTKVCARRSVGSRSDRHHRVQCVFIVIEPENRPYSGIVRTMDTRVLVSTFFLHVLWHEQYVKTVSTELLIEK